MKAAAVISRLRMPRRRAGDYHTWSSDGGSDFRAPASNTPALGSRMDNPASIPASSSGADSDVLSAYSRSTVGDPDEDDGADDEILDHATHMTDAQRRQLWIEFYVSQGNYGEAVLLGWDRRTPADPRPNAVLTVGTPDGEAAIKSPAQLPKLKAPAFLEVTFNEYCVCFPCDKFDGPGVTVPFVEELRHSVHKGYLRCQQVHEGGAAEFVVHFGARRHGFHFEHVFLRPEGLQWSKRPPEKRLGNPISCIDFAAAEEEPEGVRLYHSRLIKEHFAVGYGQKLLVLQAKTAEDARAWLAAIASALFFGSHRYRCLLHDCQRTFAAFLNCPPTELEAARLSTLQALDLLRLQKREVLYQEIQKEEERLGGNGFGVHEFIELVRNLFKEADPYSELLRSFSVFETTADGVFSAMEVERLAQFDMSDAAIELLGRSLMPIGTFQDAEFGLDYRAFAAQLYPAAAEMGKNLENVPLRGSGRARGAKRAALKAKEDLELQQRAEARRLDALAEAEARRAAAPSPGGVSRPSSRGSCTRASSRGGGTSHGGGTHDTSSRGAIDGGSSGRAESLPPPADDPAESVEDKPPAPIALPPEHVGPVLRTASAKAPLLGAGGAIGGVPMSEADGGALMATEPSPMTPHLLDPLHPSCLRI